MTAATRNHRAGRCSHEAARFGQTSLVGTENCHVRRGTCRCLCRRHDRSPRFHPTARRRRVDLGRSADVCRRVGEPVCRSCCRSGTDVSSAAPSRLQGPPSLVLGFGSNPRVLFHVVSCHVEGVAGVGPAKRACRLVVAGDEPDELGDQVVAAGEVPVGYDLALQDREEQLDLVHP